MNKGLRKNIYDYICENSNEKPFFVLEKLKELDILELLYKCNSGNEMAAMMLAEFLYHNEKNAPVSSYTTDALKLFFS
jgi:hypothetical protein